MDAGGPLDERVYQVLLRCYPTAFRERFGDELVQLAGDLLRDARTGRVGSSPVAVTWLRLFLDVALTAPAEHLEQRRVARSVTRPASVAVRALGALGILGGLLLVSVWLPVLSVIPEQANLVRLALFNAGAIAVGTAILTRPGNAWAGPIPRAAAGAAILANAWYLVMLALSIGRPVYPAPDPDFRQVFLWAGVAMWWIDAALGLTLLQWRSFGRWGGLALAIGSVGAFSGMGHLGLLDGDLGWFFMPASQLGIAVNGLGWIVLGLAIATSRRPLGAPSKAPGPS